jgi:RNA polymerase sigma-70 factor, ECF subfamily
MSGASNAYLRNERLQGHSERVYEVPMCVDLRHARAASWCPSLPEPRLLRYCSSGWKFSRTICRIPVRPFVYVVKAWQPPGPKTVTGEGEIMTQYLVAIHHPDGDDPSAEDEAMSRDIDALNVQGTLKNKNTNHDCEVEAHLDDGKLISDGLQGDRNAFEILFSRYRPILYGLAQRILHNHEESEDAVQNCSLVAFCKMDSFKCEGAFRSWLARILVNEAITILRKRKRIYSSEKSPPEEQAGAAESLPDPNPEQILAQKQSAKALIRKLSLLSSGQRVVLLLCEIYGYTAEEVGAMLQLPQGAIRSRLFRARRHLASTVRRLLDIRNKTRSIARYCRNVC